MLHSTWRGASEAPSDWHGLHKLWLEHVCEVDLEKNWVHPRDAGVQEDEELRRAARAALYRGDKLQQNVRRRT